jgi:hypothetical protein
MTERLRNRIALKGCPKKWEGKAATCKVAKAKACNLKL